MRRSLLFIIFIVSLLGCGGGGATPPAPTPPSAPTFTVTTDGKPFLSTEKLLMSWSSVPGATIYQLFEDTGTSTGFIQLGVNIPVPTTSSELPISSAYTYDWKKTKYAVRACANGLCSDFSNEQTALSVMVKSIGYFKASNTEKDDSFGFSVSLSKDGNTLAIGASGEDSSTTTDPESNAATSSGAVYLFVRTATTSPWTQQAYLKASNAESEDQFGYSLSLSADGNTLAVGAIGESSTTTTINGDQLDNSEDDAGAVYLFTRTGTSSPVWEQEAYIKASNANVPNNVLDEAKGDPHKFGFSVSLSNDGNTLAVGAPGEDSNATGVDADQLDSSVDDAGAVYLFTRTGTSSEVWSQEAYIKASNTESDPSAATSTLDQFGSAVSLSGDGTTLGIGAPGEDSGSSFIIGDQTNNNESNSGAVYVFTKSSGAWVQEAYIKAVEVGLDDSFGAALSLSNDGNKLAVGDPGEDGATGTTRGTVPQDNSTLEAGAVYLYTRATTTPTWSYAGYIKAFSTDMADDEFGFSVSLSGDGKMLAVGARGESSTTTGIVVGAMEDEASSGAVYLFTLETLSQQAHIRSSNPGDDDSFGSSVSLSDDGKMLAVGAPEEDSNALGISGDLTNNDDADSGAVYLY
ncbi:MAG: integrin [Nitrospirota bacterium]